MKQNNADSQVIPFPKMRRLEAVMFRPVQRRPMIHGLLEVGVTRARACLRDHESGASSGHPSFEMKEECSFPTEYPFIEGEQL